MSRSIRVLTALALGLLSAPALAADNSTLPVCSSCTASEVFANKDIGGVKFPKHILYNSSGTEVGTSSAEIFVGGRGTAGTAAGGVLSVQGIASMTPLFMQSATVPVSTMNSASANSGVNSALSGVFDDTSPTAITENSFGFLRMSANRNLYGTIRDAAGNERGANVNASGQLSVTGSVFGPTANGAAAANPPVLIGGTANGAATGNVSNWKVDSSGTGFIDCVTGGTLCTALANGVQTAASAVGTQLIAWGINVAGNARQPTGSNPTGTSYAVHHDLIAINGTTVDANSGNKSAGTQRMVVATDQPTMTNPQPVSATPYPIGATPYTATATGTTAATTATLAGSASVTTYLCGFSIRANATAAATGNATVTGVITATMNFTQWTAPLASGLGITEMIFSPCIPASATNTSVAVVSAAPGSGGTVSVSAWGYKL